MILMGVALIVLAGLIRRYRDKITNVVLVIGAGNSVVNTVTTNTTTDSGSEKSGRASLVVNILALLVGLAGVLVAIYPYLKVK